MRQSLKHLGFGSLVHSLTLLFLDLPDRRQKSKVKHSIHDVVMSQMRDIWHGLMPSEFRPVFKNYMNRLQRGKQLE
jgi:hypothetical protein